MMKFLRTQMKWIMAIIVVAFLLSTFLMYEGRGTRRTPSRNPDGTMTDYEVAQINGRSLMRSELEQRLRNYLSTYSTRSMTSIDMPAIYRSVLDQAILESQMLKEVEEKGIKVSDAEADQAMKNYADTYFPTREAFYQVLANSGLKVEDYKRSLARQIAADRLMSEAIGVVTVSEDKAVEFYDTMKGILYSRPEGFNIHMADFNSKEEAEKFRAMLEEGASWDVLASGDTAGAINITRSPVMLPESALKTGTLSVLDSLDVGTLSPVFEVASGDYAVAVKAAHVEAGTTPYDEVSGDIRILLTQQEERNRLAAYQDSLMKKANVVINDTELFASEHDHEHEDESGDVLPVMTIEEVSEDETPEEVSEVVKSEDVETAEESADVPAVETETKEASDDVSAVETEIAEESTDVPAVETETKEASDDVSAVETETKEASDDVPAVEAETKEASDDASAVEIELVEVSEDSADESEVVEAVVVTESEDVSTDKTAVTETVNEVSADKQQ
ncbi:MAG: SurA N-terminal domain-containing protein [Synergistaceae bacterium]|nr:SurA N-terminal domain-containing protein [Synergistaceae bacterium]